MSTAYQNVTGPINSQITELGFSFTVSNFLWAAAVLVAAFILNKVIDRFIERAILKRGGDEHAAVTAKKASSYVVFSGAFVVVLGIFGVPVTALGTVVGLIGLGISFALKDVIANFISGLMILVNRPFKIGDQIQAQGMEGVVKDIRIRATDVRTFDGRRVIMPNSMLYNDIVINDTAYDKRRFSVIVGISYDDDIQTAKELAMETLEEAETVEQDPEPQVLVDELGDSSVNLKLRAWTSPQRADIVKSSSEITQLVKDKYDAEGIDIPYPIRTVYMEE